MFKVLFIIQSEKELGLCHSKKYKKDTFTLLCLCTVQIRFTGGLMETLKHKQGEKGGVKLPII